MRFHTASSIWEFAPRSPAVLAIGSLVAGGLGTAVSTVGAIQSANAQQAMADYQAQVAKNNAITAKQNADYAIKAGQADATAKSLQARSALGQATADLAASGVDVNTGSAADAQVTEREFGKLDAEQETQKAALQAYGYRSAAKNFQDQAALDTAEAAQAPIAGALAAGGDLLSGASSLGSKWTQWQNEGVFGDDNTIKPYQPGDLPGNTIMSVYG